MKHDFNSDSDSDSVSDSSDGSYSYGGGEDKTSVLTATIDTPGSQP